MGDNTLKSIFECATRFSAQPNFTLFFMEVNYSSNGFIYMAARNYMGTLSSMNGNSNKSFFSSFVCFQLNFNFVNLYVF